MSSLRMLFPQQGWERVCAQIAVAQLPIFPVLLGPDGLIRDGGRVVSIDETGVQAAWFSPDLFALGQDEMFLKLAYESPDLVWFQSGRAGYDHPGFAALASRGIRISTSKAPIPAMAEYLLHAVLDHFQQGPQRRKAEAMQRWISMPFLEVAGSHWVLVGYGDVGRETAQRAKALGVHVTGVRRSGGTDVYADSIVTPAKMDAALAQADVVILSVPLTAESDGAYGKAFFDMCRPGCLFINVGRGQLLDEDALRMALDNGQIGHAVLDVTRVEPLPPGEWQWSHERVTLTAHVSGIGSGLIARTDALLVDNLGRFLSGKPLLNELKSDAFADAIALNIIE